MPDPNGAREFAGIQGPVINGKPVRSMVYESPAPMTGYKPSYYFCCQTCGNCGRHWLDADYAVVQAASHMFSFDHTPYLDGTYGDDSARGNSGDSEKTYDGGVEVIDGTVEPD